MTAHSTGRNALITGASGGIGEELARQLAARGINLMLVARSEDKLLALSRELRTTQGVEVHVLALDLNDPGAAAEIQRECQFRGIEVDFLINNAGFGDYGVFYTRELHTQLDMITLNITALTELTHRFLGDMVERRRGRVLNVASTAAFLPGPLMAVYYASKAYVLSFSEALNEELKGTGVNVTALCPGPVETGFQARAQMEDSRLLSGPGRNLRLMSAHEVAHQGIEAMLRGEAVCIPGAVNKVQTFLPRLVPRKWVPGIVKTVQDKD